MNWSADDRYKKSIHQQTVVMYKMFKLFIKYFCVKFISDLNFLMFIFVLIHLVCKKKKNKFQNHNFFM